MKHVLLILFAIELVAPVAIFAAGGRETAKADDRRTVYPVRVFYEFSKDRLPDKYPYHARLAEEKLGLRFEYEFVPAETTVERTNLLFAAGDHYDMHPYGLRVGEVNRWALEGHIVPLSDHWDRFPNYRKWWDPDTWEMVERFNVAPDGKLYMLMSQNPRTISRGWTYRKDLLDAQGLSWPTTVDEYYVMLRKLKDAYPDAYPLFTRGAGGIFTDVTEASWRTAAGIHFDIDSGDLVYGAATDKYRELLIYFSKLYRGGLMDPEYITNTRERENEIMYVHNTAITVPNWTGTVPYMNMTSRQANPDVTWDFRFDILLADESQRMMVTSETAYYPWGPFLTRAVQGEKLDRMIEYLDWIFTDEGMTARYFGKEGETFVYKATKPVFMDHMQSQANPAGQQMWQWGLENYPIFHPDREVAEGDIIYQQMTAWSKGKDFIRPIAWGFEQTEEKDRADVQTVVDATRDQFRHRFVLGDLDASKDADWQRYLNELREAGVGRLLQIHHTAYDRSH